MDIASKKLNNAIGCNELFTRSALDARFSGLEAELREVNLHTTIWLIILQIQLASQPLQEGLTVGIHLSLGFMPDKR